MSFRVFDILFNNSNSTSNCVVCCLLAGSFLLPSISSVLLSSNKLSVLLLTGANISSNALTPANRVNKKRESRISESKVDLF